MDHAPKDDADDEVIIRREDEHMHGEIDLDERSKELTKSYPSRSDVLLTDRSDDLKAGTLKNEIIHQHLMNSSRKTTDNHNSAKHMSP